MINVIDHLVFHELQIRFHYLLIDDGMTGVIILELHEANTCYAIETAVFCLMTLHLHISDRSISCYLKADVT